MKDVFGVEVRMGDTILASANSFSMKIGKVYGFNKNGLPLVDYQYDNMADKYSRKRGPVGTTLIVLHHEGKSWTSEFWDAVFPDNEDRFEFDG